MNILNEAHGIMFHHFHDEKHIKCQGSISADDLKALIDYYNKDYNIISASEFYDKAIKSSLGSRDVCLTFDDALLCQYEVALPVLETLGLNAFWFVYTSPFVGVLEKLEIFHHFRFYCFDDIDAFYDAFFSIVDENIYEWMGIPKEHVLDKFDASEYKKNSIFYTYNDKKFRYIRDEILKDKLYVRCMEHMMNQFHYDADKWADKLWMNRDHLLELKSKNHIIGLHSHSHPTSLDKMEYEQQYKEYEQCSEVLKDILGDRPTAVSYPCNSFNDDTTDIMHKLNIQIGFTATRFDSNGIMYIPREDHTNIVREMRK